MSPHQPHPLTLRHVPQTPFDAHGSVLVHELGTQSQVVHDPLVGPVALPARQVPLSAHQPQPAAPVQPSHVVSVEHVSVPPEQSPEDQSQFAHVPALGPVELPLWQAFVLAHQPHGYTAVQPSQAA